MHQSKLNNGLNLITVPMAGTKATTVLLLVPVGSRYEHRQISGASHFVEHLMFKGTTKRPTAWDISRELDASGAEYNAFTSKDYTGYYVKIDSRQEELAFDLVSDMVFNSRFDAGEIEKEKGVIVEELRMYEDNPSMAIGLLFDRTLFGDCPLGWDEGGSKETVRALSRDQLWNYYRSAYFPANMVLAVSGGYNARNLKKFTAKYFSVPVLTKEKINKSNFKKFSWPKATGLVNRVAVKNKEVDQAHVLLGFPGIHNNSPRRYALSVLQMILGGGMSSRLFVEVREKRGLAYMIHSGAMGHRDTGAVYVRAGLDPRRLAEALGVIKEELHKMAAVEVTPRELKDAKSSISGRTALALEESNAQAEWYAKQFWFADEITTPEETVRRINKVTAGEVKDLAQELFDWKKMRLAVIGPVSKEKILKMV